MKNVVTLEKFLSVLKTSEKINYLKQIAYNDDFNHVVFFDSETYWEFLSGSFSWKESIKGWEYWLKISRRLSNIKITY